MQFIGTGDRILTENFNVGYLYTITFKTGIYINSACIGIGDTFVMFQKAEPDLLFTLNVDTADEVDTIELYDSGGGTNDYDDLVNRPQINSHTLTGNMSGADLGLQNTISDLDTIRAGAAAGATAVQPAALSDYQPVITDLDTIRAGAAAGATAVQPADMTSALAAKQDALSTAQLAAVNSGITSTDVAQITTNKNNISSLNQYAGGKNKFNIDSATINASDASYTKNSDGTINVTKSTNTIGQVNMQQAFLGETGTYIISGCPSGGSSTTYEMLIQSGNTVLARDYGEGASVSLTKGTEYQFKVVIRESQALSNKLFKPMISIEGGEYQPYAMSNVELTEKHNQLGTILYARYLSDLTFTKSLGGLYYSNDIDISTDFDEVFSAGLANFSNVPNIAINTMLKENKSICVVVCDPTSPASLSFSEGSITIRVFGRKK